jgi:hypothetical protein
MRGQVSAPLAAAVPNRRPVLGTTSLFIASDRTDELQALALRAFKQ